MSYSPNLSNRPAFVKACGDRKRFAADIIRSVQNPDDFKKLYEHIFPNNAAPNVKLPDGYREILQGTLLDGKAISDVQLENVRSNLMEALREPTSALSVEIDEKTRGKLQKVVMVTAPNWVSTFRPVEDVVEKFANEAVDKLPLPKKNLSMLQGPVTILLLLFAVMMISFVVRMMIATSGGVSESMMIKQLVGSQYDVSNSIPFNQNTDATKSNIFETIISKQLSKPQLSNSYGILPGFVAYEILQVGILILYMVLLPFVLILSNASKMFGMRNMEFIETVESMLFSFNRGYTNRPRFSDGDKIRFVKKLMKAEDGAAVINPTFYYSLDEIKAIIKNRIKNTPFDKTLQSNYDTFVNNNLKRFLYMEKSGENIGKYKVNDDTITSALDSFNLFQFSGEQIGEYLGQLPDFLTSMGRGAFSYPVLVQQSTKNSFKIESQFYWDTFDMHYMKIQPGFPANRSPEFKLRVGVDPTSRSYYAKDLYVQFQDGTVDVVDYEKMVNEQAAAAASATASAGGEEVALDAAGNVAPSASKPKSDNPSYLRVRKEDSSEQTALNAVSSYLRSFGVFSGFIGSTSTILILLILIVKTLDNMSGSYSGFNPNLFEKMIFVSSDAYYNWIKRSDVGKADVAKFTRFITESNVRIKVVDTSKATNDKEKIDTLIDYYNSDVSSSSFVSNQIFYYICYILCIITLPYTALWLTLGTADTSMVFDILGPMGMKDNWGMLTAPIILALISIILFIVAMVYLSKTPFHGADDKDNKADYWQTTENNDGTSPMKANKDFKDSLAKTWRFLTANGDSTSSLSQMNQDKRLLTSGSIFNSNAFYRSRVIFITNQQDLAGYYTKFVQPLNISSKEIKEGYNSMDVKGNGDTNASGTVTTALTAVMVVSAIFVAGPFLYNMATQGQSSLEAGSHNLLKSGTAVSKFLTSYLGDKKNNFVMMGVIWSLMGLLSIYPIVKLASYDEDVVVGVSKKGKMYSTELAYGSVAYISKDAITKNR